MKAKHQNQQIEKLIPQEAETRINTFIGLIQARCTLKVSVT